MVERVTQSIFRAIDEVNQLLPKEQQLEKSSETILSDSSAKLDSLGLVNLIVATEQKIEEEFGVTITLADAKAMYEKNSPFKTIKSLTEYISLLLVDTKNDQ